MHWTKSHLQEHSSASPVAELPYYSGYQLLLVLFLSPNSKLIITLHYFPLLVKKEDNCWYYWWYDLNPVVLQCVFCWSTSRDMFVDLVRHSLYYKAWSPEKSLFRLNWVLLAILQLRSLSLMVKLLRMIIWMKTQCFWCALSGETRHPRSMC